MIVISQNIELYAILLYKVVIYIKNVRISKTFNSCSKTMYEKRGVQLCGTTLKVNTCKYSISIALSNIMYSFYS